MALDFSSQGTPLDFSSSGEATDFSSQGTPVEERVSKKPPTWGEAANNAAREIGAGADVILGLPGFVASAISKAVASGIYAAQGEAKPFTKGAETINKASENPVTSFLTHPIQSMTGYDAEKTLVGDVFGALTNKIDQGGKAIDSSTGNSDLGEGFKQAVEVAMVGMGVKGAKKLATPKGLTEADILASIDNEVKKQDAVYETGPIDFAKQELGLVDETPQLDANTREPLNYENGIDFYGEPAKAGERLTPDTSGELSLMPKVSTEGLELTPKESTLQQMASSDLQLEPLPEKAVKQDPTPLEFEKVDPNSLKTTQQNLDFSPDNSLTFKTNATPEQGADFIDTIPRDVTDYNKGEPSQLDLPNINRPLGQSRFGKGQRGSITFGSKARELSPEEKARSMNLQEYTADFIKRNPQYANKPEVAAQVYQRLNNPVDNARSLKDAVDNSYLLKSLDKGIGSISTRVGNMSQSLLHNMRGYELNLSRDTYKALDSVHPFVDNLHNLPKDTQSLVNNLLLNNKTENLNRVFDQIKRPDLKAQYANVRSVLDKVGNELKNVGRISELKEEYFPRMVTDVEGLKNALGSTVKNALDERLLEARRKAMKDGVDFGPVQESELINNYLRSGNKGPYKPGFAKERKLDDVTPDLEKYYASPIESLHTYLRNATSEVALAKFFGKSAVKDAQGRIKLDESIGALLNKERTEGKLNTSQIMELESILRSRHGPGNQGANKYLQDMKNVANMGLLGDITSTISQGQDLINATYINGFKPTYVALVDAIKGRSKINIKDLGLADHVSEEFVNNRPTSKALRKVFKASFFSGMDHLGKTILMNGAIDKATTQLKSQRTSKAFEEKWKPRFGDDYTQLVKDLREGKRTDLTDMLAFSEVSRIQPVSKLEMPQKYLDMPNGRVIYMMKSFMMKQLDLARNDIYNEIKKGNTKVGLANAARLTMILGLGGATADYIKDAILYGFNNAKVKTSGVVDNVLKNFGLNTYVLTKFKEGAVGEGLLSMLAPPLTMFDDLFKDAKAELDGDMDTEPSHKSWKYIPIAGKTLYSRYGGGLEKEMDKRERAEE